MSLTLFKNFALFGSDKLDVDIIHNQRTSKSEKPLPYSQSIPRQAVLIQDGIIAAIGSEEHCMAKASELQQQQSNDENDNEEQEQELEIVDGNQYLPKDDATGDPLPPILCPGFIDSHAHYLDGGGRLSYVLDMSNIMTKDDFSDSIRKHVEKLYGEDCDNSTNKSDEWVFGSGWDDEYFGGLPHKSWIDKVENDRPVFLYRCDLHTALMNSAALRACEVDRDTPQPVGGVIEHDEDGEPNGLLRDGAVMEFARRNFPKTPHYRLSQALAAAQASYHSTGITCVHDMTTMDTHTNIEEFAFYRKSFEEGKLQIRMRTALRVHEIDEALRAGVIRPNNKIYSLQEKEEGKEEEQTEEDPQCETCLSFPAPNSTPETKMLRLCFLKMFTDGALGSRTARMHQPYAPRRGECYSDQYKTDNKGCSCGIFVKTYDNLVEGVTKARQHCLLPCLHAIGDAAVTAAIDAFKSSSIPQIQLQAILNGDQPGYDCPFAGRIEHCQHVAARDLPRLKEHNIVASVQPLHMASDAIVSERVLGNWRRSGAFPLASLMRQFKVHMSFGSDWPVVSACPAKGIHAAVTRRSHWEEMPKMSVIPEENPSSSTAWDRRQCLTMRECLSNYTVNAAATCPGDKNFLGRLRVGYAADFAILSPKVTALMIMKPQEVSAISVSSPAEVLNDERNVYLETWVNGEQMFKRQQWF